MIAKIAIATWLHSNAARAFTPCGVISSKPTMPCDEADEYRLQYSLVNPS
jgi:hypothetical protein